MNINWIEHEYGHLKLIENDINYQFEPPFTRKVKSQKRNINFGDLKEVFIDELATFGFSPFIHRSYASQNHDKNITKYKKKKFNYGLYNYVKKKYGKNVINHNLNRHNKFENKKIDGHYLYQTLYQIDVLKSYDEEDDNEIIKKANEKTEDKMYKLIAIDLDGTLLNSYGEVSENTKEDTKKSRRTCEHDVSAGTE